MLGQCAAPAARMAADNVSIYTLDVVPNPAPGKAAFTFRLPEDGFVSLNIFDLTGKQVAVVFSGYTEAGEHAVTFEGRLLPAGMYIYRMVSPQGILSGKLAVVQE